MIKNEQSDGLSFQKKERRAKSGIYFLCFPCSTWQNIFSCVILISKREKVSKQKIL